MNNRIRFFEIEHDYGKKLFINADNIEFIEHDIDENIRIHMMSGHIINVNSLDAKVYTKIKSSLE